MNLYEWLSATLYRLQTQKNTPDFAIHPPDSIRVGSIVFQFDKDGKCIRIEENTTDE